MYIRVKRKKTTIFLHVDATDTVLEIKQKLQELVEQVGADLCCAKVCMLAQSHLLTLIQSLKILTLHTTSCV